MSKQYENLLLQLDKLRRHNQQGSFKTRERYYEAMKRFCRFLADHRPLAQDPDSDRPMSWFVPVKFGAFGLDVSSVFPRTPFRCFLFNKIHNICLDYLPWRGTIKLPYCGGSVQHPGKESICRAKLRKTRKGQEPSANGPTAAGRPDTLSDLTPVQIQQFVNHLVNRKDEGKRLNPKAVKNIHGVLHSALRQAVRIGYLKSNPASLTILPRRSKTEITPLQDEQVAKFLQTIKGHPFEYVYLVDLFTGIRQSEILGLEWEDVGKSGALFGSVHAGCVRARHRANAAGQLGADGPLH